jgi:hypothetical protein
MMAAAGVPSTRGEAAAVVSLTGEPTASARPTSPTGRRCANRGPDGYSGSGGVRRKTDGDARSVRRLLRALYLQPYWMNAALRRLTRPVHGAPPFLLSGWGAETRVTLCLPKRDR